MCSYPTVFVTDSCSYHTLAEEKKERTFKYSKLELEDLNQQPIQLYEEQKVRSSCQVLVLFLESAFVPERFEQFNAFLQAPVSP